mgnify:CR=1 FL=1
MGIYDAMYDAILADDYLSVPAVYTPFGGVVASIRVTFDNAFVDAQGLGVAGVGGSIPQAGCKSSDTPAARRGDTLEINGTVYIITEAQPDGTGWTILMLSKD